jgi:hypothetical protein
MKANILRVTREARDAGKPWAEALTAAQAAGYTGSIPGLSQMLSRTLGHGPDQPAPKDHSSSDSRVASAIDQLVETRVAETIEEMTTAIEYKAVTLTTQQPPDAVLNELGQAGWTLVSCVPVSTVLLENGAQVTRIQYVFRKTRVK